MSTKSIDTILEIAKDGITKYLMDARQSGRIDSELYQLAQRQTFDNLKNWLVDPNIDAISRFLKKGIIRTIENAGKKEEEWGNLVNAFRQWVQFGTGGIRGLMGFDKRSIEQLKREGIDTDILKGPNTINDLVFLVTSLGVATYGKRKGLRKVVIGYDSRIRGYDFAAAVAQLFLYYDYEVYFFDAPCPYPEVTFAIPKVRADIGVMISASHNDYRYNGYKLSCANGSQFDPEEREEMYNRYIVDVQKRIGHARKQKGKQENGISLCPFRDAPKGKLVFLGGSRPVEDVDYAGREGDIVDMHAKHLGQIKKFLLTDTLPEKQRSSPRPLRIAFCAFHGAGNKAVPRLLRDVGFVDVKTTEEHGLNELNGLFPAFSSEPGREQQPDPGDPRAAKIAVEAFKEQYRGKFKGVDILIGTDPDADRCGIVVKVPEGQRDIYRIRSAEDKAEDYYLLPADDMWTLILWYRLHRELEEHGKTRDAEKKFVSLSHTTSDSITFLARKHGLGVVKTWVGFAMLAAATRDVWEKKYDGVLQLVEGRNDEYREICHPFVYECIGMESRKRSINVAALEQSNGFSILGGPPPDSRSLGKGGHVRDKDGTFAALLVAEIAAWAKAEGTSLIELLDQKIYVDPDIGMFATFYEPDPLDGEYPGIEGDRIKKDCLRRALGYYQLALAGDLKIGGRHVRSAAIYRTGKYDGIHPPTHDFQFPDEGVRFYLDDEKLEHVTIRPSGTTNSLRFHIQLHARPAKPTLMETKSRVFKEGTRILADLRELLKRPYERQTWARKGY